jgi:hypothetical protein
MRHTINVSANERDAVFYSIDRMFDSNPHLWVFLQLPVAEPARLNDMLAFVRRQLDKEYNKIGCLWNMLCCCCGHQCGAGRVHRDEDSLEVSSRATAWFCSELVTALLQVGGYGETVDTEPRLTTPQMLFDKAATMVGVRVSECPRARSNSVVLRMHARA